MATSNKRSLVRTDRSGGECSLSTFATHLYPSHPETSAELRQNLRLRSAATLSRGPRPLTARSSVHLPGTGCFPYEKVYETQRRSDSDASGNDDTFLYQSRVSPLIYPPLSSSIISGCHQSERQWLSDHSRVMARLSSAVCRKAIFIWAHVSSRCYY